MSKHEPSLLERAAEVYDFTAFLRAPTQPEAAPVEEAPARHCEERSDEAIQTASEPELDCHASLAMTEEGEAEEVAETEVPEGDEEVQIVAWTEAQTLPVVLPRGSYRSDNVVAIDRNTLTDNGFIVPDAPVTGLAEEFRLVKRQLLAGIDRRVSLPEEKRRTVLITSGQPNEGKSFCAINLALSLAGERDVEVLLIDGDVSRPDALVTLGIDTDDAPGLVEALADPLADPENFVIRTDVPGLSVLPAGAKANNVPELLASDRTRAVLAALAEASPHRIILFDSPPALLASPAAVLAGHVGQVLVVVRADRTTEADLRETIGLLSACDHIGLLLNGAAIAVNGRKFGAYDGYGYGS